MVKFERSEDLTRHFYDCSKRESYLRNQGDLGKVDGNEAEFDIKSAAVFPPLNQTVGGSQSDAIKDDDPRSDAIKDDDPSSSPHDEDANLLQSADINMLNTSPAVAQPCGSRASPPSQQQPGNFSMGEAPSPAVAQSCGSRASPPSLQQPDGNFSMGEGCVLHSSTAYTGRPIGAHSSNIHPLTPQLQDSYILSWGLLPEPQQPSQPYLPFPAQHSSAPPALLNGRLIHAASSSNHGVLTQPSGTRRQTRRRNIPPRLRNIPPRLRNIPPRLRNIPPRLRRQ